MDSSVSFGRFLNLKSQVSNSSMIFFVFKLLVFFHCNRELSAVLSMQSIQEVAFAMATLSDALAKEARHQIRIDECRRQIACVQGEKTIIFTCDGRPPSTVITGHLPGSFVHVPGPASSAPKVR